MTELVALDAFPCNRRPRFVSLILKIPNVDDPGGDRQFIPMSCDGQGFLRPSCVAPIHIQMQECKIVTIDSSESVEPAIVCRRVCWTCHWFDITDDDIRKNQMGLIDEKIDILCYFFCCPTAGALPIIEMAVEIRLVKRNKVKLPTRRLYTVLSFNTLLSSKSVELGTAI